MKQYYDVIIVGSGIAGAATSHFIRNNSKLKIAVVTNPKVPVTSELCPGYVIGGAWDNYTRLTHAHSPATGRDLWKFGDYGRELIRLHCEEKRIPLHSGSRIRVLNGPGEAEEAAKAVADLKGAGFQAVIAPTSWDRKLTYQSDGPALLVPVELLLDSLLDRSKVLQSGVRSLVANKDSVQVNLEDDTALTAEMVVVASHLGINQLVSGLEDVFVSFADQWQRVRYDDSAHPWPIGTTVTMNHTYEWGVKEAAGIWCVGGGRYLRPMAGIEATAATFRQDIADKTAKKFGEGLGFGILESIPQSGRASLGCRPCDELPVIGPMFGEGRILLAGGFMQNGLACGFAAGKSIASLILNGKAAELPRSFWPERQRSLGEQV